MRKSDNYLPKYKAQYKYIQEGVPTSDGSVYEKTHHGNLVKIK